MPSSSPSSLIDVSFSQAFSNIGSANWDTFIFLFFGIAVVIYAFFVNRERLAVVLLSVYTALALMLGTPFFLNILKVAPQGDVIKIQLGTFIGLFLLLYVLFSMNMSLRSDIGHAWWQAVLLSVLQVGLLLSSILYFIPHDIFSSDLTKYFFTNDIARSAWMTAPIAAMFFMRKKKHDAPPQL
jgi:hypothetical protein